MHHAKDDIHKVELLNGLSGEMEITGAFENGISYATLALQLSKKINYKKGIADGYSNLGNINYRKGKYPEALKNHFAALTIYEKINDKDGTASTSGNMGLIYFEQGNYPQALDYYFKGLKVFEETGNMYKIAGMYGNIAIIYTEQSVATENDSVHALLSNKALEYYLKGLTTSEALGEKDFIGRFVGNIGNFYSAKADHPHASKAERDSFLLLALDYYFKAMKLKEELGDVNGFAIWLENIGAIYFETKDYNKARDYFQKAVAISDSIGDLEGIIECRNYLSRLDSASGNFKSALENYKKYIAAKDSIINEENTKKQTRLEMNYEFEKKEAAVKAESDKQQAVAAAESKKQKIVIWSVIAVLLLVAVFTLFIFRALRITKKQKKLIEEQKRIVEEKQKEILDSIRYAKRIQTALLPTETYIHKHMERLRTKMPE